MLKLLPEMVAQLQLGLVPDDFGNVEPGLATTRILKSDQFDVVIGGIRHFNAQGPTSWRGKKNYK